LSKNTFCQTLQSCDELYRCGPVISFSLYENVLWPDEYDVKLFIEMARQHVNLWLIVQQLIMYKLAVITFKTHSAGLVVKPCRWLHASIVLRDCFDKLLQSGTHWCFEPERVRPNWASMHFMLFDSACNKCEHSNWPLPYVLSVCLRHDSSVQISFWFWFDL